MSALKLHITHTVPCAALIMTREYRVVQSLEEFSSSSIAVWDILWLAGCKLGGVAGHEAISWFSAAAFQPRKWVQIRKVPSSVARSNTLPTSWLTRRHIRPFHSNTSCFLERVAKFSVSPLSWHFITHRRQDWCHYKGFWSKNNNGGFETGSDYPILYRIGTE